jgi:phosphatidate cytidylyltransferase
MLAKRVLSAVVLIPIVALAVYVGGWGLFGLIVIVGLLAGYEYLRLLRALQITPALLWGLLLILLLIADAQWPQLRLAGWGLALVIMLSMTHEVFRGNAPGSLPRWALTLAGGLYIGFFLGHALKLRALDDGLQWTILAIIGTWICDTGAYFVGSKWGRRRFFPAISPKKTWEGALGGLVSGMVAVILLGWGLLGLSVGWGTVIGLALVLGATFGDLAESVIKRQVGVKDSGQLIPGHGGMLDRIDSLLFVFPIVYYLALIVG